MNEIEGSQTLLNLGTIYWSPPSSFLIEVGEDISADFHHYAFVYNHENQTGKFMTAWLCMMMTSRLVPKN